MERTDWANLLRFKLTLLKMDPHRNTTILYLKIIISGNDNFIRLTNQLWREHINPETAPYVLRFQSNNNRILLKWYNNEGDFRHQTLNIPLFVPPFF